MGVRVFVIRCTSQRALPNVRFVAFGPGRERGGAVYGARSKSWAASVLADQIRQRLASTTRVHKM